MSKLTAPFFSFRAKGQIGKSLVFFPWKGLNVVRTFVVPANPNTADQQTQRGYFTLAVSKWHDVSYPYLALDLTMWNFKASLSANPLTGFNNFVRMFVDTKRLGNTPQKFYDATISGVGANAFTLTIKHDTSSNDVKLYYGTSPTALINVVIRTEDPAAGTTSTFALTGLTSKVIYYFHVLGLSGELGSYSGVGYQKTS